MARRTSDARSGDAFVWGAGDSGQLGLGGDVDERRRPACVKTGPMESVAVTQIASGGTHTLALASGARALVGEQRRGRAGKESR